MIIADAQVRQFREEGYFVLESALSEAQLDGLRAECQRYIDMYEAEMEARGVDSIGINHYKKRYFIHNRGNESPIISDFLCSPLMTDICRATLGPNAYLFHEQYVVKAAESGMKFGWHQDSGYVGHYHKPYLSCWCALDDMSEANGTIYVLPYGRAGMQPDDLFEHVEEEGTHDRVGYHGDEPGLPVIVPAGSIVVFSSRTFHRSGANTTDRMRRSYLAQYSSEPIMNKEGSAPHGRAVQVLRDGERITPDWSSVAQTQW